MYVLHMSRTALAGVAYKYATFFKKYGHIETRSAFSIPTTSFPEDIRVPFHREQSPTYKNVKLKIPNECPELIEEIKKADIIHIHNSPPLAYHSPTWELMREKPIVLQLHSPPGISDHGFKVVSGHLKISKLLVIAQYQAVELKYDNMIVMRNIVDINHEMLRPIIIKNSPPIITYTPTNIKKKEKAGWAYKSVKEVMPVLESMGKNNMCKFVYFHGKSWLESLKLRQQANVHIDEISSGSYHLGSLEALSQGTVTVAHIADWMEKVIKEKTGCDWLPWVEAGPRNFQLVITSLVKDQDKLLERQHQSRKWMEQYWSPEKILNDYMGVYNSL